MVGHRLTVDLGLHKGRHHAVVGLSALALDVCGEVRLQTAHARLPGLAARAALLVLRVFGAKKLVGVAEDVLPRVPLDRQQLADRRHRHLGSHIADEIGLAAIGQLIDEMGSSVIHHRIGDFVDPIFQQPHPSRREAPAGRVAVLAVLGRVHVDQIGDGQRWIVGSAVAGTGRADHQALAADERLRITRNVLDVVVLRDRPERRHSRSVVPVDRGLTTQQRPLFPWVAPGGV